MKTLILAASALLLASCAELNTAFEILDILTTPTERQICESDQVGGMWLDGECYTAFPDSQETAIPCVTFLKGSPHNNI